MTETPRFKILPEELRVIGDGEDDLDILCEAQKNHTLKQVIEWGNGECSHPKHIDVIVRDPNIGGQQYYIEGRRKDCSQCWAELKKEAE